ncbi:MAG TPA: hypothetical protein PLW66_10650 [Saprospiraceae bacterium]|nr:hypothetical protein [Saprospiraceae bacterium]
MTLFISEYITITLAGIAVFFSLQLAARLMNAYLRWHDRLHISKEDRGQIVSTLTTALVFGALTFLSAKDRYRFLSRSFCCWSWWRN